MWKVLAEVPVTVGLVEVSVVVLAALAEVTEVILVVWMWQVGR